MPQTSVFGAVLLTGYLGGAIATHVRIGNPLFTHVLFPIYIAVLIWGALFLRDRRVRALIALRTADGSAHLRPDSNIDMGRVATSETRGRVSDSSVGRRA